MSQADINEIELSIKEAKDMVAMAKAVERLYKNADFKQIVLDGYFENEAVRLVHLKADPAMQDEKSQKMIIQGMDAIGALRGYFNWLTQQGNLALKAIEDGEDTLDELRAEGLD